MMNESVETVEYKGYNINIYPDNDAQSPEDWHDDNLFLVGYHRDFTVDRGQRELITIFKKEDFKKDNGNEGRVYADGYGWKNYTEAKKEGLINKQVRRGKYQAGISEGLAQCITNGGKYEDGSINDEAKQYIKDYYIFGLNAYIHSGVSLSLGFYIKPKNAKNYSYMDWDRSNLGLVFVSKKEVKTKKQAEKLAQGLIEEWNLYLSGSIYGYMISKTADEEDRGDFGGCWGFYGYDHEESGLIQSAKDEIDAELKEDKEKIKIAKQAIA